MNTLKAKAISEIRSTIATLTAHPECADRIEGLQVLLGELEAEEVSKGTPTYQEIEDFAETFMMPGQVANKEIKEASIKSAQWAISLQPEWVAISSANALPTENGLYWVLRKGFTVPMYKEVFNDLNKDFWIHTYSHYVQIVKPQPPTK